jgi:hypothetical protein
MSKSHEFAWCAGFFDGEGWVKIQKRGSNKYLGYYLRIGINHVKIDPLLEMQRVFGGNIRLDENVIGNRRPRHVWTLSTKQANDMLICILPYLKNKNKVVELALEFQNTVGATGQRVGSDTQIYRGLLADQIKHLNSLD